MIKILKNLNQAKLPCGERLRGDLFFALLLALLFSFMLSRALYHDATSFSLQVTMSASVHGQTALYVDTGAGFTPLEVATSPVWGNGQFWVHAFPLPVKRIYNFRLDPLETAGEVAIKDIRVVDGSGKLIFPVNLGVLKPAHQIQSFDLQDHILNVVIEECANDPQIAIPLEPSLIMSSYFKSGKQRFIWRLLSRFFLVFCLSSLLIWMFRKRDLLTGFLDHPLETVCRWITANKLFFCAILCLLAYRTFFVLTYPLNTCSDQGFYYQMMRNGASSLLHASGYPFFMRIFSPFPMMQPFFSWLPEKTNVLIFQHLIDFGAQLLIMILLKRRFGTVAAIVAGLLYGLDLRAINWVSRSTPEWLHGVFFALAFVGAMEAYFARSPRNKIFLYLLSAWAFSWTILMKFLTVVLLPIYPILFLLEARKAWKGKWLCLLAMGGVFFAQIGGFLYFYHYPATGTTALTSITGWTLDRKISSFLPSGRHLSESGSWSKRYCVLVSEMPYSLPAGVPAVGVHGLFSHVNEIPSWVRKPYQDRYRELSVKSESELESILLEKQEVRGLDSYMLSYHFLGLQETDRLMEKVFAESVARYPKAYLREVMKGIKRAFLIHTGRHYTENYYIAILSNPGSKHPFQLDGDNIADDLCWGYARYNVSPSIACMYDDPVFLKSGLTFFTWWGKRLYDIPVIIKWVIVFAGVIMACIGYRSKRVGQAHILYLSLGIMVLLLFIIEANMIFEFRDKEFMACQHLFNVLVGISVSAMISFWKRERFDFTEALQKNEI